ncbi:MAG: aminotransferase class V-fold PLP-dependent enzyme [Clostridiales bacterium]|nr:aminotransferase class V-fold PLP-dependent enzyme [Clostridiales bacterium]
MIYFDNAATTMFKPESVIKANDYALRRLCANAGRGSHASAVKAASIVYEARKKVRNLVACDDVIFTFNCTDALNTVLFGTARRGGHVVTTVYEHNSTLRPLTELGKRMGVEFTAVTPNTHGIIDPADIERAIRRNTYMIAVNQASNVTGAVAPAASIGAIARRHGLLYLIDGAQSVGYLDVDMKEMGANFLCFSPHKGLHGPQGVGCLCVRGNPPLHPFRFGGTGTASHTLEQPADLPEGFECGTMPVHSIFSLIAAITHFERTSLGTKRNLAQCGDTLREELGKINKIKIYGKYNNLPNIVSFNIDGFNSAAVGDILSEQYDVAVRCGLHCAPLCHKYLGTLNTGVVRASLSYNNTMSEVEFFVKAIREIAK